MMKNKKWIEEYIQLKYPVDSDEIDLESAMKLKFKNIPKKLYKYRAVNDNSKNNLKDNTIWMNRASEYNDPYDCALMLGFSSRSESDLREETIAVGKKHGVHFSKEEIQYMKKCDTKNFYKKVFEKNNECLQANYDVEELSESVYLSINKRKKSLSKKFSNQIQKSILCCSFSERNDSMLMWSHYAANHTGMCIEYDFTQLGEKSDITRMLQPVIYRENIFDVTKYLENTGRLNILFTSYLAMIKAKDWEYENEWRYIIPERIIEPFNKPLGCKPTAIYLGSRINTEDERCIREIAEEKSIPVINMQLSHNKFKIEPIIIE